MSNYLDIEKFIKYATIKFARSVFSDSDYYKYDDDNNLTSIMITDEFPDNLSAVSNKPSIVFSTSGIISPMDTSNLGTRESINQRTGAERYLLMIGGQGQYEIGSENRYEATNLAQILFQELLFHKNDFSELGFNIIKPGGFVPAMPAKAETPTIYRFTATVPLAFYFNFSYVITKVAPLLKTIYIDTDYEAIPQNAVITEE